ncbi:hypothetical protein [Streptomyces violascens]|uniref:Secreted protein n=1 Tax=Streptomyces violascens TaxID=67381 RepID=A0ABQ3QML2_9ACTN|nr:hypothetical protein [Streptomyces violascens]GGT99880.1 hypothetical protein GCM10010289_20630 [Streptomyces violascens]GHI38507.1 hypothetical protein Sviol_29150 [Streptomyces violascens]
MNIHHHLKAATVAASLLLLAAPGIAAADGSAGHGTDSSAGHGKVSEFGRPEVLGGQGRVGEALSNGMAMMSGALQRGGGTTGAN